MRFHDLPMLVAEIALGLLDDARSGAHAESVFDAEWRCVCVGVLGGGARCVATTRHQRDWFHKAANVLDALPKSAQPTAKRMLAEIRDAEDRDHAAAAANAFADEYGAKFPKAVATITDDLDVLLTFYDFPCRALDPPQDQQPDRIDLLDGPVAHQGHQVTGIASSRPGDRLQS